MTRAMTLREWQQHEKKYIHIRKEWFMSLFYLGVAVSVTLIGLSNMPGDLLFVYIAGIVTGFIDIGCVAGMVATFIDDED